MDPAPPAAAGPGVVAVVSLGGMLGAAARYGAGVALPPPPGGLPWSTALVNVSGCLLIGLLVGALRADAARGRTPHRLLRPFLAVGVLGGYTTFSTYTVNAFTLAVAGRAGLAAVYLLGTALLALLAVQAGLLVAGALHRWLPREAQP